MSVRMMQARRIAGLLLGLGCLAACDGDGGTAAAPGGGAWDSNHRGPANSKMPTKGSTARKPGPRIWKGGAQAGGEALRQVGQQRRLHPLRRNEFGST